MSYQKNGVSRQTLRGFTLTELMIVVVVIGLLMAFAAPSILTLNSTSLTTGAHQLSGYLNHARSEAIRDGRVVRVVLVRKWAEEPDSVLRRLSSWKWDDEQEKFVQSGRWEILPEGLVIVPEFPDYVRSAEYAKNDATTVQAQFPTNEEKVDIYGESVEVAMLDFMPNGQVRQTEEDPKRMIGFVVVQGHLDRTGEIVLTSPRNAVGNPVNWAQVNVDALTGRVQVHRP